MRTPEHKLKKGEYRVKITLETQNGVNFVKELKLIVSDKIEHTSLGNI